jgi:DNA-binding transcriptional ArsR family regulator
MMAARKDEAGLVPRLQRLNGEDAACRISEYAALSQRITRGNRFPRALERAKALADERRLAAASLLRRRRELCACEIQAALKVSHATVSHHMAILTEAGIVSAERRGKWMYYRLNPAAGVVVP